ncbi:MAG: ABC transporter ATP-binding protein [Anaerolineales bacterium]|nr:ABC transporter ATP-binding protein [Anaerolineales bacterium]
MKPMLTLQNVQAGYGKLTVLQGISLDVYEGEFISLLGPNGAGKTTTLRTVAGFVTPTNGSIEFNGRSMVNCQAEVICQMGISYISESLNLFRGMSVKENLLLGAFQFKEKSVRNELLDFVFSVFPRLRERENQLAGTMSGGEQKMLAIARGLMARPKLILVDEPSLGLAPQLVKDVFRALRRLQKEGVTILLVEQNVRYALKISDRGYILENGAIVLSDKSAKLRNDANVRKAYMGI